MGFSYLCFMPELKYSFIIPVYNRPEEISELLHSFTLLHGNLDYEIVIVEDGSTQTSEAVVNQYRTQLNIRYFKKENSGPGDSRNVGMTIASGTYFIILDSDVILSPGYLVAVNDYLYKNFVHCFGGPDGAAEDFNRLQKAINYTMTSVFTTGGIRGHKYLKKDYQARSFNMGLSKKAFESTGGFGNIHPGEDPELVIKLKQLGYAIAFIADALVYHKRRLSWSLFFKQVYKFGSVRPILNKTYPHTKRLVYWFPTLFMIGFILSFVFMGFDIWFAAFGYLVYYLIIFFGTLGSTKDVFTAFLSVIAVTVQFSGYGIGFLMSTLKLLVFNNKSPEELFPDLYFINENV